MIMVILDTLSVTNYKAMLHTASGNSNNVAGQYINPDDILNPLNSNEVSCKGLCEEARSPSKDVL